MRLSWLGWLALVCLGCGAAKREGPPPGDAAGEEQATPSEPATADGSPSAEPPSQASQPSRDELPAAPACLSEPQQQAIAEARRRFEGISSSGELHAARAAQVQLNRELTDTVDLCQEWPEGSWTGPVVQWLEAWVPGSRIGVYAEGTASMLELDLQAWAPRVRATPEGEDDAFFALAEAAWTTFDGAGWPRWNERNWDYGGCSQLAAGAHRRILKLSDGVAGVGDGVAGAFTQEALALRAQVLAAVVQDDEQFPHCRLEGGDVSRSELAAELRRILDEVELSEAERAPLEARLSEWQ